MAEFCAADGERKPAIQVFASVLYGVLYTHYTVFCNGFARYFATFAAERRTQVRVQHLHRDVALVLEIVREVHSGHTAGAEFALEALAIGQRGGEAFER